ncbi:hypothetical protein [Azotobacter chroococcum]|uniref:DUF1351 domain-containing protein n=1 Tax=Azotobacter chroococcum TaxID=353 RepID=A0AAP9YGN2_9GAMM|nr:hypothetical protein [Azotobacter chroococcum]QQE90441.1 hypothetical protein GKQ51_09290 [Azotobacter chroococcum]
MTEATELAVIPKESALEVFRASNGLDPYLAKIRAEIDAFVPDVSTRKGRDAIASIAHKVARSKTALDNVGKELVAELKEIPKKIDAERKRMRDTLDAWRDEVRAPLNEWEAAEAARVDKHEQAIEDIEEVGTTDPGQYDAEYIRQCIANVEVVEIGPHWEEFEAEAARTKDKALTSLRAALTTREKHEAEQAELERLRAEAAAREQKEREERIAREAAERAQREAEQRAQAEREAAARREAEAKAAAEQAKRDAELAEQRRIEAEKRAEAERLAAAERERQAAEQARQAEIKRQAEEQARLYREAVAREADKAHKAKINRAALDAFIAGGMPEACAKQAVTLIAQRKIPQITISY